MLLGAPELSAQGQPSPQERAGMLKQWLQASQQHLRTYEWIETTVVSAGGEEKSRTAKRCYYGVDGKLQKIVVEQSASEEGGPPGILPPGRLLKKAAEHKKEEMTATMQKAVDLVHQYIPPSPAEIQRVVDAGKLGVQVLEPGRRVQLNFADYLKPGDSLGVEIETPTNRLLGMSVSSYLDSAKDPIALRVTMSVLPDGTIYVERSVLDATAEKLNVTVENTGYRHVSR
jgi:hypothetical protein